MSSLPNQDSVYSRWSQKHWYRVFKNNNLKRVFFSLICSVLILRCARLCCALDKTKTAPNCLVFGVILSRLAAPLSAFKKWILYFHHCYNLMYGFGCHSLPIFTVFVNNYCQQSAVHCFNMPEIYTCQQCDNPASRVVCFTVAGMCSVLPALTVCLVSMWSATSGVSTQHICGSN